MIICEIGLNHKGNKKLLFEYAEFLCKTDCDAITIQERESDYYKGKRKHYIFDKKTNEFLIKYIKSKGKKFGVALSNHKKIRYWVDLGVDFFKVLSWDLLQYKFIEKLVETNLEINASTGCADEIDLERFYQRFKNNKNIKLIHTQLSPDPVHCNLKSIETMKRFNFPVSYCNHCKNLNVIYASLTFNPEDIWFYVKKGKEKFPDDSHAVELKKINGLIKNIKQIKKSIGNGIKNKIK